MRAPFFHPNDSHYFELSPIKGIELEASKIPGVVSLAQGIPNIPVFPELHEFVCEQVRLGKCDKYSLTNGLPELREEIARHVAEEEGLHFDPEREIIVTCGSIEGITASLLALTKPGDEVILPSPTYASYGNCIRLAKCKPRWVELDEDAHFDFQIERLAAAINSKTRVLLFCLPNNPTSTVYSQEKLRQVLDLAKRNNLYLLVDEVYKDFYYEEGLSHFSPLRLDGARERTIRICSFSKAYSLTGWRVGFLCAEASLSSEILRFHDAMVTCAPVVSQYAAIGALKFGDPFLKSGIGEYRRRRDYALSRMADLSRYFDYQVPRAGYFLFPRLKDSVPHCRNSRDFVYDLLREAKVATVYGSAFGPSGEEHIRLNFGRKVEELECAFDRIASYLRGPQRALQSQPQEDTPREVTAEAANRDSVGEGSNKDEADDFVQRSSVLRGRRRQDSSLTQVVSRVLQFCSRRLVRKERTHCIVCIGERSRTLLKRAAYEFLKERYRVRVGALSYNTPVGVALAVLDERAGRTLFDWLGVVTRSLATIAWPFAPRKELLLLEFGAYTREELRTLLRSAPIDTLIVSPSFPAGPEVDATELRSTLELARSLTSSGQVIVLSDGLSEDWYSSSTSPVAHGLAEDALCAALRKQLLPLAEAMFKEFQRE